MISYGKQHLDKEDIEAVVKVLEGDWLTQGPAIKNFEDKLSAYFNSKYCSVVSNGTAALHLTSLALGWNKDDYVITTPITFLADANAIVYSGATPLFVDIEADSYTIDVKIIYDLLKKDRKKKRRIKAIIAVDYAGHPCDWKTLRDIADEFEVQLINDNCHAMGAEYFSDAGYAAFYADCVIQSYHPVKHITTGEGGSVLTNIKEIDKKIKTLRTHGINRDGIADNGPWYYEMHELGYNYRLTDIQAALGISQLLKLEKFLKKRHQIAADYTKALNKYDGILTPPEKSIIKHAYHLYPLLIDFEKFDINKIQFFREMKKRGINLQVHYIPVHLQPFYRKNFGCMEGNHPIAEDFYLKEVSLPIYPDLLKIDQKKVILAIKDILKIK